MRYLPLTADDRRSMLSAIGAKSIDDLFTGLVTDQNGKEIPGILVADPASKARFSSDHSGMVPPAGMTLRVGASRGCCPQCAMKNRHKNRFIRIKRLT